MEVTAVDNSKIQLPSGKTYAVYENPQPQGGQMQPGGNRPGGNRRPGGRSHFGKGPRPGGKPPRG